MTHRMTPAIVMLCFVVLLPACSQAPARVESRDAGPLPVWVAAGPGPAATAKAPAQASAQASTQASAEEKAAVATNEYRLGPGDVVKISVYGNPDLATETEVSLSGAISFPLVGEVAVGGMTRGEAERAIADSLGKGGFVPNAHVNLLVAQYRSRQIAVMGEVNKPGTFTISRPTSITEVLAMAGGISPKGSDRVTVIRRDANGSAKRYEVDVRKLLAAADPSAYAQVDKDDIVFVPVAPVFYIYGEVRQPGSYPLAADMTVRQALSLGGGLTVRGTERGIRLERKGKESATLTRRPSLDDKLQPNDVLYVPEGWF